MDKRRAKLSDVISDNLPDEAISQQPVSEIIDEVSNLKA